VWSLLWFQTRFFAVAFANGPATRLFRVKKARRTIFVEANASTKQWQWFAVDDLEWSSKLIVEC